jgi:5-methylcytosine-specific restriction protein A
MPRRPLKGCFYSGCPNLTDSTYCDVHKKQKRREYDATRRPSYSQKNLLYESPAWRRERKNFLINHPLCAPCLAAGRVTQASEVDHIEPHKGNMSLFWDASNWQAICKPCHNRKTSQEKKAIK